MVDEARVEIHVRVQLALDEVLIAERSLLKCNRDFEKRVHTSHFKDVVRSLLDDGGTWVEVLVDAVTESHESAFA